MEDKYGWKAVVASISNISKEVQSSIQDANQNTDNKLNGIIDKLNDLITAIDNLTTAITNNQTN